MKHVRHPLGLGDTGGARLSVTPGPPPSRRLQGKPAWSGRAGVPDDRQIDEAPRARAKSLSYALGGPHRAHPRAGAVENVCVEVPRAQPHSPLESTRDHCTIII